MPKTVKIKGDKSPADNEIDILGDSSTSVKAGKGNDLVNDHGGGNDQVRGGAGDDTVAFYYTGNESGVNDYDGDKGSDTLQLHFTRGQWLELNSRIQVDLDAFLAHLASANKKAFSFTSVGIEAGEFENVQLFVDGLELSPNDDSVAASDDDYVLDENTAISENVLANDLVPDLVRGVALTGNGVNRGTLLLNADGSFEFATNDDFETLAVGEKAAVEFTYRVTDATRDTDDARVTVVINGQNDAPLLQAADAAIVEDGPVVTVDLSSLGSDIDSDDDGNSLHYSIHTPPSAGLASISGTDLLLQGGDDFQSLALGETTEITVGITATDTHGATASNEIDVTVTGTNDLPVLLPDLAETAEDGSVALDVLANDSDIDASDILQIISAIGASHGSLSLADGDDVDELPNDLIIYTPDQDFSGIDNFDYTVSDGNGGVVTQTTQVNVAAVADTPTVTHQIIAGATATQFTLRVNAAQTDLDGSEVIDRIVLSGTGIDGNSIDLSPYVNSTSWSAGAASGNVTADFHFTLPAGSSSDFEITATAFAKEPSNSSEASNSTTAAITSTGSAAQNNYTFTAQNQSIWAGGDAYSYNGSFNTGGSFQEDASFGTSVIGPIDIRVAGTGATTHFSTSVRTDVEVDIGLQSRFGINGGKVDAVLNYSTDVVATLNKTTDVLSIKTHADNYLPNNGFTATTPNINFEQALTEFALNMDFGLFFWGYLHLHYTAGTSRVVHMPNIWDGLSVGFPAGFSLSDLMDGDGLSLARYDGNALHLLEGLYTQHEIAGTKEDNLGNELFSWLLNSHNFQNASESVNWGYNQVTGSESRDFATITFDLDGIASHFRGIPNPVHQELDAFSIGPLSAGASAELLDIDLVLSTAYRQDNFLNPGALHGSIVFEDNSRIGFVFGDQIDISDASLKDANGDGQIDYYFEMRPDAQFQTNAFIDIGLRDEVDVLSAHVYGDVEGFGGIGVSAGPIEEFNGTLIDTQVPIQLVGSSFGLNVGVVQSDIWAV
jgi:VCBS repeat-containing protein